MKVYRLLHELMKEDPDLELRVSVAGNTINLTGIAYRTEHELCLLTDTVIHYGIEDRSAS